MSPVKKSSGPRSSATRFDVAAMERAVRAFLRAAGLEVEGTHLEETPELVSRAWIQSFLDGYEKDPSEILKSAYPVPEGSATPGMVLLKDVPFHGVCPHHLLPFHGIAHVAYLPEPPPRVPLESRPRSRLLRASTRDPGDRDPADR